MRAGVMQLARWGLLPEIIAAGTPAVTRTAFHYGEETVPVQIKSEHGVDFLCAPRRTVLDRVLVDAARRAGADVRHGVSMTDLQYGPDGRVTGVLLKHDGGGRASVRADLVIGADGRQSAVARRINAPFNVKGTHSSGYVYGYYEGLPDDGYHWYFENGTAAGMIPTNHEQHCVFAGVHRDQFASTSSSLSPRTFDSLLIKHGLGLCCPRDKGHLLGGRAHPAGPQVY